MTAHTGDTQSNTSISHDLPLLEKMVNVIVEVAQPEQIVLFGSRAKGTAQADSDYDFLIIDAKPFDKSRSRRQQISKVSRALAALRVPTDLLIYSSDEVKHWRKSLNHVVGRALREGHTVYERH
ncbi:MAG: nucleotidyltransferase domain-containing protein [Phormidesmis sp.]